MMYFLLILFFGSLLSITFMVGKKLILLRSGTVIPREEIISKDQYLEELKYVTIKNIKKYSYLGLVASIRFYFHFANLLKKKYQETKIKIKEMRGKRLNVVNNEKREASKFLKMISEYKHKIRNIKRQIKEEEESQ